MCDRARVMRDRALKSTLAGDTLTFEGFVEQSYSSTNPRTQSMELATRESIGYLWRPIWRWCSSSALSPVLASKSESPPSCSPSA